jgi:cytochrome c oxidase cbb3-type subunit III
MMKRAGVPFVAMALLSACHHTAAVDVDLNDFHFIYHQNCSGCHGDAGKGGPGRQLNDPVYLSLIPKDRLRGVIEKGRPGTAMPAFAQSLGGALSPEQVTSLVDGIEREWAKPVNFGGITPPPYSADAGTGSAVHGKELFDSSCAGCHGPAGRVGPVTDASFLALVSDQWLRTSILAGQSGRGMPDWRALNRGKPLSGDDVTDLVAYLVSLRPANASQPK